MGKTIEAIKKTKEMVLKINERKHAHRRSFTSMFVRTLFIRPSN